jgi:STE24 endopeptidase
MKLAGSVLLLFLCVSLMPQGSNAQDKNQPQVMSTSQPASTTAYTLPPDKLAQSKALYERGMRLLAPSTIYPLVVLLALLHLGIAAKYRDWAEKASRKRFIQALIFVFLLEVTISLTALPLSLYWHTVYRDYGLSVQGWGSWFSDYLKGKAIFIAVIALVVWGFTTLIRKSPRRWWFYFWIFASACLVFVVCVKPIIVDPLFDKFEPLEKTNPALVSEIEKVTQRGGLSIPRDRMFLMKASEKVTTLNAYVTGLGPSKRVVVWDTTVQKASTRETLFIFGHEMGHYVLNHIVLGVFTSIAGLFVGCYLLFVLSRWTFARFQQRWHMRDLSDWAAIPMMMLIFSILMIVSQPIESTVSRQLEHNADVYGLEVTHGINANSHEAGAHAFQTLGELSLSYPYPNKFVVFWYYSHPPISDRVRFAHEYDPWSKGEQPKYVK